MNCLGDPQTHFFRLFFLSFIVLYTTFTILSSCRALLVLKQKIIDCKTVVFFLKISKEIGKAWRKSDAREPREPQPRSLFSASFHTFSLTARAYLNTQKIRTVLQSKKIMSRLSLTLCSNISAPK